jgi:hypothetical protein
MLRVLFITGNSDYSASAFEDTPEFEDLGDVWERAYKSDNHTLTIELEYGEEIYVKAIKYDLEYTKEIARFISGISDLIYIINSESLQHNNFYLVN